MSTKKARRAASKKNEISNILEKLADPVLPIAEALPAEARIENDPYPPGWESFQTSTDEGAHPSSENFLDEDLGNTTEPRVEVETKTTGSNPPEATPDTSATPNASQAAEAPTMTAPEASVDPSTAAPARADVHTSQPQENVEHAVPEASPLEKKCSCKKCRRSGSVPTQAGPKTCWRCKGKGYQDALDMLRNPDYDTGRGKRVKWAVMIEARVGNVARTAPRGYGENTEIYTLDGDDVRMIYGKELKEGMKILTGNVRTGELLVAQVSQVVEKPLGQAF